MQQNSFLRSNDKGFTLIELLAVIMIIGVLAAIGVPRYFRTVERSKVSEATRLLSSIREAEERYCLRYGVYTGTIGDLDVQQPASPKYFTGTPTLTYTAAAGTCGTYSANWLRNNTAEYPSTLLGTAAGGYNIVMDQNGTTTSAPSYAFLGL